jgi:hypothetical protein
MSPQAKLVAWGAFTTVADTLAYLQLLSQDMIDPLNGENLVNGSGSLLQYAFKYTNIPYKLGQRQIKYTQNTGANPIIGWTLDAYPGPATAGRGDQSDKTLPNQILIYNTFTQLTANTWGTKAYAPATAIPNGKYAILGGWVTGLTNSGLIRFAHADFGAFKPGFPVVDMTNTALANASAAKDPLILNQGYQFCYLGELAGRGQLPVFNVTGAGTGLNIEALAITADTPTVFILIAKVG